MRFGNVALVGRTNVGKSTFLNRVLGEPLAITSPLPQTTRDTLLGVASHGESQLAFIDTPGLHRPRTELGRRMNRSAFESLRAADVVVLVTDVWPAPPKAIRSVIDPSAPSHWIRPGDLEIVREIASVEKPCVLVVNKVDLAKDKSQLLPMLEAYSALHPFAALVPTSIRRDVGVAGALDEIERLLPEGPPGYDADTLTNRPVLYFVREYVREAVLNQLDREVPHAVAVTIDRADESPELLRIAATIHVEKVGQRKIVVGAGGSRIKELGTAARLRIAELVGKKVHLELFVRVSDQWKDIPRQLAELGYDSESS